MAEIKVGTVTHFYDKISVAVILLTDTLSVGDTVRFVRGGEELFEQLITSIQYEHQSVESAESGQEVGIKVDQKTKDATEVYKIN